MAKVATYNRLPKKQRHESLPDAQFDIFEDFFNKESAHPLAPDAVRANNAYATMWFVGEAAPPNQETSAGL